MVSRFSHMSMFRLLVEDRRNMFYGESPKFIHCVKKVTFNSPVVCVGNGASHVNQSDQRQRQQQHNIKNVKHDDGRIRRQDVVCSEGRGGVGDGGVGADQTETGARQTYFWCLSPTGFGFTR